MKNSSINLRVSEDIKHYLEGIAKANEKSVSDVVRLILEEKIYNESEVDEEYETLKIKAQKIKAVLENNDWIYVEGEHSTLEIKYDSFDISVNIYQSYCSSTGSVLLDLKLYRNSNLILVTHLTNNTRFEIKKVLDKNTLFITKL